MEVIEEKDLAEISSGSKHHRDLSKQIFSQQIKLLAELSNANSNYQEIKQAFDIAVQNNDLRRIVPLRKQLNALFKILEEANKKVENYNKNFRF